MILLFMQTFKNEDLIILFTYMPFALLKVHTCACTFSIVILM